MQALSAPPAGAAGEIRAFMQARGFTCCDQDADVEAFRRLAGELIPAEIASVPVLATVQTRTQISLFLHRSAGRPDAFIALLPLSDAGEAAITGAHFDGTHVDPCWVRPFSAEVRAGYVWGLGGATRAAAFSAMRALRVMRDQFFAGVRLYARPTTFEGRRLMEGFGYAPAPGVPHPYLLSPALSCSPRGSRI